MGVLKSVFIKMGGAVASLALTVGLVSATSACVWWYHQPIVPKDMEKYIK